MPPSTPILILADDLSGAAELAGIAFQHGLSAEVQRTLDPTSTAQVIAIDTDSRSLSPTDAAARVQAIAEKTRQLRPAWLYKKVDSILRGNVRSELESLPEATGLRRAILVPANPSRNRIISGGRYYIDGVPLDQTTLAADPHHPRHTADVFALLGRNGAYPVDIPDVRSGSELAKLATTIEQDTLPAGAADFFQALLSIRGHPPHPSNPCSNFPLRPPVLLVCGSRVSWPTRYSDCAKAGIPSLTIDATSPPPSTASALLLGIGEAALGDQSALLSQLANTAAMRIAEMAPQTLLLEGGATAAAIAERLNWKRFSVVGTAPAGVGVLRPQVQAAPLVLIKPGSYPWPPDIWQAFINVSGGPLGPS